MTTTFILKMSQFKYSTVQLLNNKFNIISIQVTRPTLHIDRFKAQININSSEIAGLNYFYYICLLIIDILEALTRFPNTLV